MKFLRAEKFRAGYRRLSKRDRELFKRAVRQMNEAYAARGDQALPLWPASPRIRDVAGAPGVFEMTWSFAGPSGRATFEYVTVDGEPASKWRRIGDHRIFQEP